MKATARLAVLTAMLSSSALGEEMRAPAVTSASVDWEAVRSSLNIRDSSQLFTSMRESLGPSAFARLRIAAESNQLGLLNQATSQRFPNVALSPVPVLLPFNTEAFLRDVSEGGKLGAKATSAYLGGFSAAKYFAPGPSGYDAALSLAVKDVPSFDDLQFRRQVEVQISGSSVLYELATQGAATGQLVPELQDNFPGIRRLTHEGYLRYTFIRFGAPYVVSVQCRPDAPSPRTISCAEADRVVTHFLNSLQVVGGTPAESRSPAGGSGVEQPPKKSPAFTYYSPGELMPFSGYERKGGRKDYTVYATMRFPIANAPAFANSQEFLHWGNCFGTGRKPPIKGKDDPYRCAGTDKQLYYNEGHKENYSYPWRDNFCEMRDWPVGQCPGGHGHQGQDIRPAKCTTHPKNSSRCKAYQHDVVAVRDAVILRSKGQQALFLVVNAPHEHIRFRYLHMLPKQMDADRLFSGKGVREGDKLGKVGNYLDMENGTTYHLHFDIQVPTKNGWVWVNPYMTLIAAYERLIGAKGTEITAPPAEAHGVTSEITH